MTGQMNTFFINTFFEIFYLLFSLGRSFSILPWQVGACKLVVSTFGTDHEVFAIHCICRDKSKRQSCADHSTKGMNQSCCTRVKDIRVDSRDPQTFNISIWRYHCLGEVAFLKIWNQYWLPSDTVHQRFLFISPPCPSSNLVYRSLESTLITGPLSLIADCSLV